MKCIVKLAASIAALFVAGTLSFAQAPGPQAGLSSAPAGSGERSPARAAEQTRFTIHLDGVTAVQLAWWFKHLADEGDNYWKPLAPSQNSGIEWLVNPREDAHQLIGAVYQADQAVAGNAFVGGKLHTQYYFADYVTQSRANVAGQVAPLNPTLPFPKDYNAPYPTPIGGGSFPPGAGITSSSNGFNQDMILLDGMGFAPGRLLFSWRNSGDDDTAATAGQPKSIDVAVTIYQPWMEGANRPPAMKQDGYYYSTAQVQAVWSTWETMLKAMPAKLPKWFNDDTQDLQARAKGFVITGIIDTGLVEGVNSKMMVWWWNHAMGDAPGAAYTFWCPPAHYTIRWLPGFSPAEVLKTKKIPTDHVVTGIIYPDLQGGGLTQTGGGMMSYPVAMSPVPGVYKTLDPMIVVSKEQVDNFDKVRYPVPKGWLLHQWEDRDGGLIHRSTTLASLPMLSPVTQQGFYSEHQLLEGQNWGAPGMRKAYQKWLKANKE